MEDNSSMGRVAVDLGLDVGVDEKLLENSKDKEVRDNKMVESFVEGKPHLGQTGKLTESCSVEDNSTMGCFAVDFGLHVGADGEVLENSTDVEVCVGPENEMVESSVEGEPLLIQYGKMTETSSGRELSVVEGDANPEPQVGMEFESEAAAHALYSAYAIRVGFIIRWSKLCRSRRDHSVIARAFVCNKEGFRLPDKRSRSGTKPRAPTRVGCKAMIAVRKLSSGKWVISKFVKEHSHPLMTPGKGLKGSIYDQYPNEHERIRDLSQQLLLERRRSAAYRRHLELVFKDIEEHTQNLSKKIQHIVDSVREIEAEEPEEKHLR